MDRMNKKLHALFTRTVFCDVSRPIVDDVQVNVESELRF